MEKKKILVIDDQITAFETIYKEAFKERPVELLHKQSGPDAIEIIKKGQIDLT